MRIAQVTYRDRRTPDEGILAQWGDGVETFCDTLGIEKPIMLNYSLIGMVLQAYGPRAPNAALRSINNDAVAFHYAPPVVEGNLMSHFIMRRSSPPETSFPSTTARHTAELESIES